MPAWPWQEMASRGRAHICGGIGSDDVGEEGRVPLDAAEAVRGRHRWWPSLFEQQGPVHYDAAPVPPRRPAAVRGEAQRGSGRHVTQHVLATDAQPQQGGLQQVPEGIPLERQARGTEAQGQKARANEGAPERPRVPQVSPSTLAQRGLEYGWGRFLGVVRLALLARRSLGHAIVRGLVPEGPPEVDSILKPPPKKT